MQTSQLLQLKLGIAFSIIFKAIFPNIFFILTEAIDYGHPVRLAALGVSIDTIMNIEDHITKNCARRIPEIQILATNFQNNRSLCLIAVALIKLRFGISEIFPRDERIKQANISKAIQSRLAPSARPALGGNPNYQMPRPTK